VIGNACSKPSAQQADNCSYAPSWWGRVRCTVGEDRIFLPFEWNAAEPCDQGFIGLAAVDPGVQTFTRLPCGASMVVMYLHDARRWTGSAGHGILTA